MAHFIGFDYPNPTLTSDAFFNNVLKLHGCPSHIFNDFHITSEKWENIVKICNANIHIVNKTVMTKERRLISLYLHTLMKTYNNTNWKQFLAVAEACYNHSVHPALNQTPMQAFQQFQGGSGCLDEHSLYATWSDNLFTWNNCKHIFEICCHKVYPENECSSLPVFKSPFPDLYSEFHASELSPLEYGTKDSPSGIYAIHDARCRSTDHGDVYEYLVENNIGKRYWVNAQIIEDNNNNNKYLCSYHLERYKKFSPLISKKRK
ncbi:hypothetical protein PIROE2DRAFT_64163 [Piromyces sp. E2]|nr:hypothetical protein PIROE2DRAFT_64163 [Piromyces sp. E2]|eukprot:OUM58826.1 hypothetical protein PIROE2DRAFT_64163 [Piromyces sp. E2]